MGIDITSFYIYRWRYYIGYGLIGLLLVGLLVFVGLDVPGGISVNEKNAVIKSAGISITNLSSLGVTNLPFHLLQKLSLHLFGVSNFSIKLPSLILAFVSAVLLIFLLRRWFRPNVAVITSVIAVATGQFIYIAQSGSANILYVLWPVCLLLLGTLIAKKTGPRLLWKLLFFAVTALSLYTPLSVYALIALGLAAILHPHLRYIIRGLSRPRLALGFFLAAIISIPLVVGILNSPNLGLIILGVPAAMPDVMANVVLLSQQYFGFASPSKTGLMTPVFGLGSMLIIAIGVYRLVLTRESTQSYLIIIWLVCLIPILVINPQFTSVTFLPLVLLLATGFSSIFSYWYRLFPRNPYARIVGLLPLTVLVVALVLTGLERYVYGYHYDPNTMPNFSQDLSLIPKNTVQLVVSDEERPFYTAVASYNKKFSVVTQPTANIFTASRAAHQIYATYTVDQIITTTTADEADRFYVYKKLTQ